MTGQLAFDLPARSAFRRADFFSSPANALALSAIDGWRQWPDSKMLLVGPAGSGKTHLAHIWAETAGAAMISAADLVHADLPELARHGAIAVEDADLLPAAGEAQLFHLHNLILPAGHLLLTAKTPPRDWGLALPDLVSRMQATAIARLDPPDDVLLSAVLIKIFADHQITVSPNLIPYLVQRMDRSIAAARTLVAALDAHALAQHRPVTRALAAEILDRPGFE